MKALLNRPRRLPISLVFLAYLVFPSGFPFLLSGLPLDTKPEALALYGLMGFCFCSFLFWLGKKHHLIGSNNGFGCPRVITNIVFFGFGVLLFLKILFPVSHMMSSCISLSHLDGHSCAWLPDHWWRRSFSKSRHERGLNFDEGNGKYWRIASFNLGKFYHLGFGENPESHIGRLNLLRDRKAYPIDVTFYPSTEMKDLIRKISSERPLNLRIQFNGVVDTTSFKSSFYVSPTAITLPIHSEAIEKINFRNYRCKDPLREPKSCAKRAGIRFRLCRVGESGKGSAEPANWRRGGRESGV
jgi:hypothetical protein